MDAKQKAICSNSTLQEYCFSGVIWNFIEKTTNCQIDLHLVNTIMFHWIWSTRCFIYQTWARQLNTTWFAALPGFSEIVQPKFLATSEKSFCFALFPTTLKQSRVITPFYKSHNEHTSTLFAGVKVQAANLNCVLGIWKSFSWQWDSRHDGKRSTLNWAVSFVRTPLGFLSHFQPRRRIQPTNKEKRVDRPQ
jgi:hypothetical protein